MIKNLIFDMGNVLIDIDIPRTIHAFGQRIGLDPDAAETLFREKAYFHQFEIGELEEEDFRALLRQEFGADWADDDITAAWCLLLLDMPAERLELLTKLRERYRLFLLSNTNSIHIPEIARRAAALGYDFRGLFEKLYLSHEMKLLKPDPAIFQRVLDDAGLVPEETVFIDDSLPNVEAAQALGIRGIHLHPIGSLVEKLTPYL
jgi:epoxide hydrolase-like predicted phosphatase